jgi:hypothetical protein
MAPRLDKLARAVKSGVFDAMERVSGAPLTQGMDSKGAPSN